MASLSSHDNTDVCVLISECNNVIIKFCLLKNKGQLRPQLGG